jgi:class II lanthipeptide synthase
MSLFLEQVQSAVEATYIHSPSAYSWFGMPAVRLAPRFERALGPRAVHKWLASVLQAQLYTDFYCQGIATPSQKDAPSPKSLASSPFVDQLSLANSGKGSWQDGWELSIAGHGQTSALRKGLEFVVLPEDCRSAAGQGISPGGRVRLHLPKELRGISPGFYMAASDVDMPDTEGRELVRFYWNLRQEAAIPLLRCLTRDLNHAALPFRFKVLDSAPAFTRCDAAVLYVRKNDYPPVSEIVRRAYAEIGRDNLNPRVPAFTKRLAPGLGLAEDPGRELDSFGLHRCRLLAEGLLRAYQRARKSLPERLQVVEQHFARNGVRLEQPYLNPGSVDIYDLELHGAQPASSGVRAPASPDFDRPACLETAARIGHRLAREAIWHQERCNWMGTLSLERSLTPQYGETFSALGPDLYSGTCGVAFFLAELHAATGEAESRRVALGAIRQALSRLHALPQPARAGLFTGWVGIALVAARMGKIFQDGDLLDAASRLVRRSLRTKVRNDEYDLIFGKAGTLVGWLLLRDLLDEPSLEEAGVRLGRKLLAAAQRSKRGASWASSAFPTTRNLTGFAHGAAGIGYALLALWNATGDVKFRRGAEAAFRYERSWFDSQAQNWPDLREQPGQPRPSGRAFPFATAWCHGAAGIALSRLRAFEVLNDPECKAEALVGLRTTRIAVESSLESSSADFSLCHGLAGNAEILLYGSRALGSEAGEAQETAVAVAARGIERYHRRENPWPCGVPGGENPGLMVGLAGIGSFYLRMSGVPSPLILIPRREEFIFLG